MTQTTKKSTADVHDLPSMRCRSCKRQKKKKLTVFTQETIGEAELAGVLGGVATAVRREELVPAGGLGLAGAAVAAKPGGGAAHKVVEAAHNRSEEVLDGAEEVAEKLCVGGSEAACQDGCRTRRPSIHKNAHTKKFTKNVHER